MRLLFTGDLYYNYDHVREDIYSLGGHFLEKGLCCIPNLEGGLGSPEGRRIWKRGGCLKQDPSVINVLRILSVKGVTLANNHMMDFGESGLDNTLDLLDSNGIAHTGAGRNIREALKPMEFSDGGKVTAVFNFGWDAEETVYAETSKPGCAPRINKRVIEVLREYAEEHPEHRIIPVLHWGFERNLYPMPFDIDLAHRISEIEEVALVIGHHPHCPQPVERYLGKKIYYSLGNFYFGKSREKYAKMRYDHEPENMSDYGVGVIFDTADGSTEDMVFFYDKAVRNTVIKDGAVIPEEMPEIRGMREYEALIRKSRLEKNPVLHTSAVMNGIKLFAYNSKRNLFRLMDPGKNSR